MGDVLAHSWEHFISPPTAERRTSGISQNTSTASSPNWPFQEWLLIFWVTRGIARNAPLDLMGGSRPNRGEVGTLQHKPQLRQPECASYTLPRSDLAAAKFSPRRGGCRVRGSERYRILPASSKKLNWQRSERRRPGFVCGTFCTFIKYTPLRLAASARSRSSPLADTPSSAADGTTTPC